MTYLMRFLHPMTDPTMLVVFVAAAILCIALVLAAPYAPRLAGHTENLRAVQRAHKRMTPRVGGLAVALALAFASLYVDGPMRGDFLALLPGAALIFVVALAEDLGLSIKPRERLLTCLGASLVTMFLLGGWLPRMDVPFTEGWMNYAVLGIPLTLFITVGLSNAMNLIDGVNGLSGMTALIALIALGMIAQQIGLPDIADLCRILLAGILGFLAINYPSGKIFLGDAGAYVTGFLLAWIGILILMAAPHATPWAILLTVFWPVADTALAIYRRRKKRLSAMQPDRLHAHQLVMRALKIQWLGRGRRHISNPLTTLILLPFILAPAATGVIFYNNPLAAFLCVAVFGLLFTGAYAYGVRFSRDGRGRNRR